MYHLEDILESKTGNKCEINLKIETMTDISSNVVKELVSGIFTSTHITILFPRKCSELLSIQEGRSLYCLTAGSSVLTSGA